MKLKILGNLLKTTLSATWNTGGSLGNLDTLPTASLAQDIIGELQPGEMAYLSFNAPAPATNFEVVQVVKSVGAPPTSYKVYRGIDGTAIQSWPPGTLVQQRIPKAALDKFAQGYFDNAATLTPGNAVPVLQELVLSTSARTNAMPVFPGMVSLSTGNADAAILYLNTGETAPAAEPARDTANNRVFLDGTAVGVWLDIDPASQAIASPGTLVGDNVRAANGPSLAAGLSCWALGQNAAALSNEAVAVGKDTLSLGGTAVADRSATIGGHGGVKSGLSTNRIAAKGRALVIDPFFYRAPETNLESVVWSRPVDFTGGQTWTANTAVKHGHAVKPTAGGTMQHIRHDTRYNEYSALFPASYVPTNTGATQPTWPTTEGTLVLDTGSNGFVAQNNVGSLITLDAPFLVTQIGIVVFDWQAITAQPSVSFGISGNNAFYAANAETTKLTATGAVQLYTPLDSKLSSTLTFSINTLATGTKLLGQVFFKGFYCPHWL